MVFYNIPLSRVVGHYERSDVFWGKPDPGQKYMRLLRQRLAEALRTRNLQHLIDIQIEKQPNR